MMERQNTTEICPLCSEHIEIYAIGACDHPVCYKCSTRMRVLHEQMYCAICRSDLNKVIFVKNLDKYDMVNTNRFCVNRKMKVFFENEEVENAYYALLQHQCNVKRCSSRKALRSFSDLKDHMRRDHNLHYCDLCLKHLKLFSSERKCYERHKLAEHRRHGDPDDRSHKGHPLCKFCDQRYLDNDELVKHLRKDHYFCHFCEADGVTNEFYSEYPLLRIHFGEEHYLCEEGDCINVEFTNAFRDDIDFKAHKSSVHSKNLRRQAAKQARTIDIEVNLAPRAGPGNRGGHRERRDRERNRGVVSREDYEEFRKEGGKNDAHGRGRIPHGRQEAQRKREELETAQAISASLASKSSVNVIDRSLLEPVLGTSGSDEDEKQKKYQRRSEDFPNLQGELMGAKPEANSSEDAQKSKSSMAKTFARSSNFSIQEDSMGQEDFPSLGNKKMVNTNGTSKSNNTAWNFQPNKSDFPALGGSGPSAQKNAKPPASTWTSAKPKQPQLKPHLARRTDLSSMQDFPSLTSIGNGLLSNPIPGLAPSGSVKPNSSKKKGKESHEAKSKPSSFHPVVENQANRNVSVADTKLIDSKKMDKPQTQDLSSQKKGKSSTDNTSQRNGKSPVNHQKEDFPALGASGSSNVKKKWGPKEKKPETQVPSKDDSSFIVLKTKSKNKKKKSKPEPKDIDIGTPSASDSEDKAKNMDSSQLKENAKAMASSDNILEAFSDTSLQTGLAKNPGSTYSALTDQSSSVNIPVILDDFPALGATKTTAPPPGFGIASKPKGPPPGFSESQWLPKSDVRNPPPGFSTPATTLAALANTFDKPPPLPEPKPDSINEAYIKPTNFADRNQKLIKDIQELTVNDADGFKLFKSLSSQFRQGSIGADEYYRQCVEILGKDNFSCVFSELLVLLPNISKQQDLLKVHNEANKAENKKDKDILKISSKRGNKGWNKLDTSVRGCPSCLQVVSSRDLQSHSMEHDLDSDFPALGK